MNELFYASISLLCLFFGWQCWKRTLRDMTRDSLFDLRDEWRDFFIKNEFSMKSKEYVAVRDMINSYLKYTKDFRFVYLLLFSAQISNSLSTHLNKEINHRLLSENKMIQAKIGQIRWRAVSAIQIYMLLSSLLIIPIGGLSIVVTLFSIMNKPFAVLRENVKQFTEKVDSLNPRTIELNVLSAA